MKQVPGISELTHEPHESKASVIEVDALVKVYDGTNVVDNVTFEVEEGEIFGIVGPNGAGKTTIVESVEGLRSPDAGSIRVLGLDPSRDREEVTERLGAQLQETRLQDRIRVEEALDLYASFYRRPADWRPLLARLGLEGKERSRYSTLSGGQKQRLSIALALIGSPEIAILDELTTGLDPQARRSTWETIEQVRDSGVTVVLVTHFMDEAERLCDRIMVVDHGRVVAIDSASGLIKRVGADHTMKFRPSQALDEGALKALPEVLEVHRDGEQIVVAGTSNVVQVVSCRLADLGVTMEDLRVDRTSLEEAYLELTGPDDGSVAETEEG